MAQSVRFNVTLDDNPAAGFIGGGVVNGVASWDVNWLRNSDFWLVEVDSAGAWVPRARINSVENENGHYEVEVGGGFNAFRIVEVDDRGQRRLYLTDKPATVKQEVIPWTPTQRSELDQRYADIIEQASNPALVRMNTGYTVVVFCPSNHVDEWEYFENYCENFSQYQMELIIENVNNYPSQPTAFREHMKTIIGNYVEDGVTLFQISGSANWYEQFNDTSWWPGDWEYVRDYYQNIGIIGEPALDDVPTWYLPSDYTAHPDYSLEYFYPFTTTDELYIDFTGPNDEPDGIPDPGLAIARLDAHDDNDLYSYLVKIMGETSAGYIPTSYDVGMMVGDVNYLNNGDGQRSLEAAERVNNFETPMT